MRCLSFFSLLIIELNESTPYSSLKKQQEARMKQIDLFETGLKTATESQKQWRTRVQQRTLELQQAQVRSLFVYFARDCEIDSFRLENRITSQNFKNSFYNFDALPLSLDHLLFLDLPILPQKPLSKLDSHLLNPEPHLSNVVSPQLKLNSRMQKTSWVR